MEIEKGTLGMPFGMEVELKDAYYSVAVIKSEYSHSWDDMSSRHGCIVNLRGKIQVVIMGFPFPGC